MTKDWVVHTCSAEGSRELISCKYGSVVVQIYAGVATTPLFKVDVPSSSKSVRFLAESSGSEADGEVKSGKIFGPTCLTSGEELRSTEVLQILMVGDDIDRSATAFEKMSPSLEGFKYGE